MKTERTKNATRNIVFGVALKLYSIIIPFLMRTAMIYFMGIQYLGLNSLFTSVLQVLNLAELGVGSAMVYSMYKPIAEDDENTICALIKLYRTYYRVIGLIIAVAGFAILPFIPKLVKGDLPSDVNIYLLYLLQLSATVFSYWLFAYKNALLQAHQRSDITSKVVIALDTFKYVAQLLVLIFVKNYYYYIIIILITQILTNIVTARIANKMFPKYTPNGELSKEVKSKINHRIRDLFTAKIGNVVLTSADTIVISSFLGLTSLAVYQNYFFVVNSLYGILCVVFSSVVAGIGNSLISESIDKNYNDLKKFTFIINWVLCVCCCCLSCMFQPFIELWVGKKYMLSYGLVVLLVIYLFLCSLAMVWATVKDAAGIWHSDRFRPLIGAGVNVILNIVLVQYIGLYGIILSTVISYVFISMPWLIHNIFSLIYKRSMKEYLIILISYLFTTTISCALCMYICSLFRFRPIIQLVVSFIICAVVSNFIQIVVFRKTTEYKQSKAFVCRMLHLKGK